MINAGDSQAIVSVRFSAVGGSRVIELNRPRALNTLNLEMVTAMSNAITVMLKYQTIFYR